MDVIKNRSPAWGSFPIHWRIKLVQLVHTKFNWSIQFYDQVYSQRCRYGGGSRGQPVPPKLEQGANAQQEWKCARPGEQPHHNFCTVHGLASGGPPTRNTKLKRLPPDLRSPRPPPPPTHSLKLSVASPIQKDNGIDRHLGLMPSTSVPTPPQHPHRPQDNWPPPTATPPRGAKIRPYLGPPQPKKALTHLYTIYRFLIT